MAVRSNTSVQPRTATCPVFAVAEGAVEIHEVHPAGARAGELARHGDRVVAVRGGAVRLALTQAHHAPALYVNGGVELHGWRWNLMPFQRHVPAPERR